ncbi:tRNA (guanine-N1)-methyltransferase [Desulfarculus baarsii DSM 2075]|uniref:tRNA (guanine-N(1)-)-methyltransferase n=1 Tax=Desulfarculus baarsii (strain ATCC 33931 / DSM 2075 / LMG 7858 / VKM B-1802 / 2st14) TaxID=644282 RepID=E1QLT3_DESB2|nr:tRNA (guanosine(37)-N1)-methyltransferase TrmD [Desulfarculus baarsii]ADK86518.1 tRNA (guanine-N1)-methyltransferase [Desulfarculus baarsii DSM 2075]
MIFDILTLLPEVCQAYAQASILGRAQKAGLIAVRPLDVRPFGLGRHHVVDDTPYGGGCGMVMMAGPLCAALESLEPEPAGPVILLSPQGRRFDQAVAEELARLPRLILVCGRYEGVDERFRRLKVDDELSVGDFVISGGELAALCVVDAVSRLLPGVLGSEDSAASDSFADGLLEHPHYTRPAVFRGLETPEVLLGGNHALIARWRRAQSLARTRARRPDLLAKARLSETDLALLDEVADQDNIG